MDGTPKGGWIEMLESRGFVAVVVSCAVRSAPAGKDENLFSQITHAFVICLRLRSGALRSWGFLPK